jgi:nicotinamide phosphoribosyltransferase
VVLKCLDILGSKFGYTVNSKGYRVLNNVRVIQGDGVNYDSILEILEVATQHGWSATNVGFGMGGALLQQVNRDTQQFAYKCSSMTRTYTDGHTEEVDVYKQPKTDSMKNSKRGRLDLIFTDTGYKTIKLLPGEWLHPESVMQTVYEDGVILVDDKFSTIRIRSNK